MKTRKHPFGRILRFTLISAVCAVLIAVYTHLSIQSRIVRAAFYGLPEALVQSLCAWIDEKGIRWQPVILDSSKPLRSLIAKTVQYDLLFIYDGADMDSVHAIVRNAETAALQILPFPVRISVQTDRRLTGTPLLINPFQVLYSNRLLADLKAAAPLTLAQLESLAFAQKTQSGDSLSAAPFLCAGKEDTHLLMFFSVLLEAQEGCSAMEKATAELKQNGSDFSSFFAAEPVRNTLKRIGLWQRYGLLPQNWLELTEEQAVQTAEHGTAHAVFAPFSFYRKLSEDALRRYGTGYVPPENFPAKRCLTAYTVTALQFSVPKSPFQSAAQATNKLSIGRALIREAVAAPSQTKLAASSLLVPANSEAQSDAASETALEFITAAEALVPDVAQAALTHDKQHAFAQALREYILRAAEQDGV